MLRGGIMYRVKFRGDSCINQGLSLSIPVLFMQKVDEVQNKYSQKGIVAWM